MQKVNGSGLSVTQCEEAYELSNESQFNLLDESIRGALPPESGLFKQITLIFNPWNEHHWLKQRFFDVEDDPDILAMTTNYTTQSATV